ncbi:MAG TPA: Calx-beta domain-containing protein [Thermoanaerobaculia bacterium]|jgi:plastocyanin|nr:Calx-beta domain-containing protein [Thermoanaerobaculia bacterium]
MKGRRWFSLVLVLAGSLGLATPAARGIDHAVQVGPDFAFSPQFLTIQAGDTVTWTHADSMDHNVAADDGSFRCANGCDSEGGDGNPSTEAWSFTRTFNATGVFGYYCEVHGVPGGGMFGTITVQALPGTLQFTGAAFSVGEADASASISVSRIGGDDGAVSVGFATGNGTATAGPDYTAASGTLNWAAGDSGTKSFSIPIIDDVQDEPNETLQITLSNPTGGAALGSPASTLLTIQDDDVPASPGTLALLASSFSGPEGGSATISVVRSGGTTGAVSVSYATSDGTAAAGSDYTAASGTLSFADGEGGTKTIPVALLPDDAVEGSESFTVTLSAPTGGAALGSPASATVEILDDDSPPPGDDLSPAEVACDAARLTGLLARTTATPAGTGKLTNLNVAFTGTGDFAGIATENTGPQTVEKALAFSSNPEEITFLRNPVRPQLFSVSVTRNDLNSDLVAAADPEAIRLAINPTLDANPPAGNLLAIDNIAGAAGRIADAKPGRGLAPLLAPCHAPFSERDAHLFRVLAKMARAELAGAPRTEIAIYRGTATGSYRLDAFPYDASGASLGRLSATLDVTFNGAGALDEGTLHILPRCTAGQTSDCTNVVGTAALALYKPEASGTPSTNFVRLTTGVGEFEWDDLLDGTTWKKPLAGAVAPAIPTLSPSETACDAGRLTGLLAKATALASRNAKTSNLAVSFTATGDFSGIATSGNGPGTPEAALAFSSNPEETTLLRNPTRPQLFSVSVTRNDLNSDLVAPGNADELRLSVNPTLDTNPPAGNLLAIDNLAGAAGRLADAKPGRGLAPILAPCHGDFSAKDVHVFRTLEKIVRGEAAGAKSVEIAIYRGEAPNTYRIDALPIGADGLGRGRLAALLEVVFTPAGDLSTGTLRILNRCTAGQTANCTDVSGTAALALFKPVIAGFPPATTYRVSTAGAATVAIDFADLLAGTSWRRPL